MATHPELIKVEESVKQKYLEIVKNLSKSEIKSFKKQDYQMLVQNEMMDISDFDMAQLIETAHYVSSALNNAAKEQLPQKSRDASSSS